MFFYVSGRVKSNIYVCPTCHEKISFVRESDLYLHVEEHGRQENLRKAERAVDAAWEKMSY